MEHDESSVADERDHIPDVDPSPPPSATMVFGDRLDLAIRYRDMLATAGIERGLIGPREVPRLWDRHIVNCAVLGEAISESASVVDIGSGAGLPGIPLAIARPDLTVTLVEPLLRRATFLEEAIISLGLGLGLGVRVIRGRAEEKVVRASIEPADVVTSRAVAPLARLAGWSAPLIRVGGRLVAIKGSSAQDEIERDRVAAAKVGLTDLSVVVCGAEVLEVPTTLVLGTKQAGFESKSRRKRGGAAGASGSSATSDTKFRR
ncbi:16S rRNA (guanine(527)-N(7))-methyltransferase RsmG [Gordonia sp. NPDC003376]